MSRRKQASKPDSGQRAAARPAIHGNPAALPAANPSPLSFPLLQQQYQELVRHHLDRLLDRLFADVTGLHFHVTWAPVPGQEWADKTLPTACSVCCRLSGSPLQPECRICGPRQLARVLATDGEGRHFTCRLGVRNYWLTLRLQNAILGVAYLQALDRSHGRPSATSPAARRRTPVVRHGEHRRRIRNRSPALTPARPSGSARRTNSAADCPMTCFAQDCYSSEMS